MLSERCLCSLNDLRHLAPKTELGPHQLEPLRHVAMIKQEILRHLGITDPPIYHQTTPSYKAATNGVRGNRRTEYKLTDVASFHSEPSDNFTDANIIQFKLFHRNNGKEIEVNNVNLLVRIKLRKTNKDKKSRSIRGVDSKRNRRRTRKKNFKEIKVLVFNITADGKPDTLITSVKSKLRKTKSIKLNLPREVIQKALSSSQRTVQFFLQCQGCDKRTRLILVNKRMRRKSTKSRGRKQPKLHKRRPILFVYSHITNGN